MIGHTLWFCKYHEGRKRDGVRRSMMSDLA
jgi:hypothetical protein